MIQSHVALNDLRHLKNDFAIEGDTTSVALVNLVELIVETLSYQPDNLIVNSTAHIRMLEAHIKDVSTKHLKLEQEVHQLRSQLTSALERLDKVNKIFEFILESKEASREENA